MKRLGPRKTKRIKMTKAQWMQALKEMQLPKGSIPEGVDLQQILLESRYGKGYKQ